MSLGAVSLLAACGSDITQPVTPEVRPRITARPNAYVQASLSPGLHDVILGLTHVLVYVPPAALTRAKVPLNLILHGSGRDAAALIRDHTPLADEDGVVLVAPYAISGTWDAINTTFGRDLQSIDRALAWVFDRMPVDPERIALSGFSDGATYTLALGRANGDLFSWVVAYSPGFIIDVIPVGNPQIAISHGTLDKELSYANTRDTIIPLLRSEGYNVEFHSFDGPHTWFMELAAELLENISRGLSDDPPASGSSGPSESQTPLMTSQPAPGPGLR